ncbi:MAG: trehalose-6-phosphate synthase [Acidimicrobiaceae bacterium]|nr:trehalose-6-phosphate synthase [Acidimicrobiaceae bacterium]
MTELVVVANRLPIQLLSKEFPIFTNSPGGLVSALHSILAAKGGTWVGWNGSYTNTILPFDFDYKLYSVEIDESNFRDYYDGFSNKILWPLYHELPYDLQFCSQWWRGYKKVNQIFAIKTAAVAKTDSSVWIHDYHLQLAPKILRQYRPDIRIGFFLHTPFPSFRTLKKMPRWREIVAGISCSHIIGFQTMRDKQNFQIALKNLELSSEGSLPAQPKIIVDPISIDFKIWSNRAQQPEIETLVRQIRDSIGIDKLLIVGIDRLDLTKGILNRLLAFRELLTEQHVDPKQIAMVIVASTNRDSKNPNDEYRLCIQNLTFEINNRFGEKTRPIVHLINTQITPTQVSALFVAADILIVSSLKDGMNLVAKEFVASSVNSRGMLILSKNTGAALELNAALQINPHDIDDIKNSILAAIRMNEGEIIVRMQSMRQIIQSHDVYDWAKRFLHVLQST